MYPHPQTHIKVGEREADVDTDIAPLIKELWKADIDTILSCQENRPGIIWIMFQHTFDAESLLNIVATPFSDETDSLYQRIIGGTITDYAWVWDYEVRPDDWNFDDSDYETMSHSGIPDFFFRVSIRFPQKDYAEVLKRVKFWNKNKDKSLLEGWKHEEK